MNRSKRSRLTAAGFLAGIVALSALIGGEALAQQPPKVSASSVFVMNADTGQVLYAKNENKVFRSLSLTKLITARVLVDRMGDRLTETVTITPAHLVRGSTAGLKRGDVWTLQDLLYGMVLMSGNDASLAIADHVGADMLAQEGKRGDARKRFVAEMGAAAAALGAQSARFADPYGLSPNNVSTARDIGLIAASVFTDPRLLPAWACTARRVNVGGPKARTVTLDTTIEILGEDGVIGGKTGTHAGNNIYNLVAAWRAPNGQTIVGVVLGSTSNPNRYNDMRAIMAALPHDYPALGGAAAGAASFRASSCL